MQIHIIRILLSTFLIGVGPHCILKLLLMCTFMSCLMRILRSPPVSANWCLFYANSTPVYLLHVSRSGTLLANDTTNQTYCIASDGMDLKTLQTALDWACGPERASCLEIQPGESCYLSNNVKDHASYAFDSYYHKEGRTPGSCDFKGVAMIITTDPSSSRGCPDEVKLSRAHSIRRTSLLFVKLISKPIGED